MTFILEFDRRFIWRPGVFRSRIMCRAWWGWFAIGIVRIPFEQLAVNAHDWLMPA